MSPRLRPRRRLQPRTLDGPESYDLLLVDQTSTVGGSGLPSTSGGGRRPVPPRHTLPQGHAASRISRRGSRRGGRPHALDHGLGRPGIALPGASWKEARLRLEVRGMTRLTGFFDDGGGGSTSIVASCSFLVSRTSDPNRGEGPDSRWQRIRPGGAPVVDGGEGRR